MKKKKILKVECSRIFLIKKFPNIPLCKSISAVTAHYQLEPQPLKTWSCLVA